MKTLVIFYSYTGKTKRLAQELAKKEAAELTEIKEVQKPGTLMAYTIGCFDSMRGKPWSIQPLEVKLADYDRLILFSPVWAGNPAPAVYAALKGLPEGKKVLVKMVSASGGSGCKAKLEQLIKNKGCTLESFEDIKAK